jgi:hypothetical protein
MATTTRKNRKSSRSSHLNVKRDATLETQWVSTLAAYEIARVSA